MPCPLKLNLWFIAEYHSTQAHTVFNILQSKHTKYKLKKGHFLGESALKKVFFPSFAPNAAPLKLNLWFITEYHSTQAHTVFNILQSKHTKYKLKKGHFLRESALKKVFFPSFCSLSFAHSN